jgi:hypothetical protein
MKLLALAAASSLALMAGACAQTKPAARVALDCPATQGDLTRTGVAADRKTCTYRTADGGEVSLQLIPVTGSASATLQTLETSLVGDAARAQTAAAVKDASADADAAVADARAAVDDARRVAAEAERDAAQATDTATAELDADGPHVTIKKDGKTIVAHGDGETAHVRLPGIHIDAGDEDAQVKIGGLTINAQEDEATVRISRDVRLKGEALSRQKRGVRATFIYTGKNLPDGYRLVGYEAAGPKTGPLAVAVVRSKSDSENGGEVYGDVKKLVRRNGGV